MMYQEILDMLPRTASIGIPFPRDTGSKRKERLHRAQFVSKCLVKVVPIRTRNTPNESFFNFRR